jgi:hypothetical protein
MNKHTHDIGFGHAEERYKYKRRKSVPYRMMKYDIVGHQQESRVRTETCCGGIAYQTCCSCGWKDKEWVPWAYSCRKFEAHVGGIEAQGTLF